MQRKCILETDGYQVIFYLSSLNYTQEQVGIILMFVLNPVLGTVTLKTPAHSISTKDLHRLIEYFEQHIVNIKKNPDIDSYAFVTYGLDFQIQALSGIVLSDNEGSFSLQVLINVGQADEGASRTYVGGESVVKFENVQKFTSCLQMALLEATS